MHTLPLNKTIISNRLQTSLFSAAMLCLLFTTSLSAQEATTTTWKGSLDAAGTELRLEIDINRDGEKLSGELRSLDQNNITLKLDEVQADDKTISFSVPQIGATFAGDLSENGSSATGTFSQSGIKLPLTIKKGETKKAESKPAEKLKEAWVGKLDLGAMKPVMQFRIVSKGSGEDGAYFDSITEGLAGFEAKWSKEDNQLQFKVDEIGLKYEGKLNEAGNKAEGEWSQGGRTYPLTLEKKANEYENKNVWDNRPQKPVGPFPYDALEVSFENKRDSLILAGTLTLPKTEGPHPAVILISGSGPQDRDESLMGHKPFLVLADYLTRRGIAVLRYDDRGTAESTGEFNGATTEDFAHDASAAIEFLSKHSKIDSKRIGLAGHSEGGLIAPLVCQLRDDVAFVALLAATGVDGKEIIISQSEAMARAEGVAEEEIELSKKVTAVVVELAAKEQLATDSPELVKVVSEIVESMTEEERETEGKQLKAQLEGQIPRLQGKWMVYFLKHDPYPVLAKIKCPVLAIIGSKDTQVLPDLNMPKIKQALKEGGNDQATFIEIDGLNHLFQKCETGGLSEYSTIQETFNPEALEKIGDWIVETTGIVEK